ncbi:MAG: AAA family ATPase [Pseudolabrys sp.]
MPPRCWAVPGRIPASNVSLLSGEGAVGKSILLLQLAVATVFGDHWIGAVPEQGEVMYLSCEDEDAEVCRRLQAIGDYYHATREDMANHGL